jgi:hypothetical protein
MATAEAWWVYCVVPAHRELPAGLVGLAGGTPTAVESGPLAAVASPVPLDEFGEGPLREHLNDIDWLERMARTHESVLEQMLRGGPVVPVRVCTIYSSEDQVRAMLAERAAAFEDTLARVEGRAEWGVKALVDRAKLESHAVEAGALEAEASAGAGGGAGAAYIARKRLATKVRDESERLILDTVRQAHSKLAGHAADAVVLPAQNRELSGHVGEMVLNGAYLVTEADHELFTSLVHELDARYDDAGFTLELSGPWPPYNFVRGTG